MDRDVFVRSSGGAALRRRPLVCCLILAAFCVLGGCAREAAAPAETKTPAPRTVVYHELPADGEPLNAAELGTYAAKVAEGAFWANGLYGPGPSEDLPRINRIRHGEIDTFQLPHKGAWLLDLHVEVPVGKLNQTVVLVIREVEERHETLLSYVGGYNFGRVLTEVVNAGTGGQEPLLVIRDEAHPNSTAATLTSIYRYDERWDEMLLVFREWTEWRPASGWHWRSELSFEEGDEPLKDLMLRTEFARIEHTIGEDAEFESIEHDAGESASRYRWDGHRYVGEMDLPAGAAPQVW
jgi:hypothetical protein